MNDLCGLIELIGWRMFYILVFFGNFYVWVFIREEILVLYLEVILNVVIKVFFRFFINE